MSLAHDPSATLLRRLAAASLAGAICQLAACGGAEPRTSVTGDPATTVEDAEAELARLEASLERTFGPGLDSPERPIPAAPPTAGQLDRTTITKKNEPASRCENACDALASMSRSADRICQLAGPGARCDAAKARVSSATTRVTAQCSECEP